MTYNAVRKMTAKEVLLEWDRITKKLGPPNLHDLGFMFDTLDIVMYTMKQISFNPMWEFMVKSWETQFNEEPESDG